MKLLFPRCILIVALFLSACGTQAALPTSTGAAPEVTGTSALPSEPTLPAATPTATVVPTKTLVMCTQDEPASLYLYGGTSRSTWSVLEAVYDGPFDTRGYSAQPVILQKIPTFADGDAVLQPRAVNAGEAVVDVNGNLVALAAGVTVLPSGCTGPACAVTWDGVSEISLDQLVVTFKLVDGIQWSDGTPLTAEDSVFSYAIASDPVTPVSHYLTDRTFSYTSLDSATVQWIGVPGYFEQHFGTFFWSPLPQHVLGSLSAASLLSDPTVQQNPLGWGPYVIDEWVAGDHITLKKNPNYFRAGEGLPYFDVLVVRFIGQAPDGNMNALLAGECDVVDQNEQFLSMMPGLIDRENEGKFKLFSGEGPEWEHLDFGIVPASYDDGYSVPAGDRPDLFGDARTRQAFASCIDRAGIIQRHLYGRSSLPDGTLTPTHPLHAQQLTQYPYDPTAGVQLLEQAGWLDADGDPATPRTAQGIVSVPDGTGLRVVYRTSQAALRQAVAQDVAQGLRACGVEVSVEFADPGTLFAPGPQGPVFGRAFDLVQFSWQAGQRPNCQLYAGWRVPEAANQWIGENISGLRSSELDAACNAAYWARPTDAEYGALWQAVQEQYNQLLPAIPLYFYPKIALGRSDLCGLEMDVTARSIFWNIEALNYGAGCPPTGE